MMTTAIDAPTDAPRPSMAEIDVFGLTHPGRVRKVNNDHFLVASFHRSAKIHCTSIPGNLGDSETQSRGFLLLVADGVGSLATAGEGSALALSTLTQHLLHHTEICSALVLMNEAGAAEALREAVLRSHAALLELGKIEGARPATTLTMFAAFWPRAFVVHVGDSRFYRLRDGELTRFTSDQTYEQLMLESGAIKPGSAEASRLKHVLWSAVGNDELVPQVVSTDLTRRDVSLLCTDGLTKHVSDDELRDHLSRNESSESICRSLLDLALARGGSDNVTVVVGKVRNK
ncbi:MAG TPA: PP2C family serine/threonine-protein phosphatase [Gemmatimonadaceae bacterium]|nr:PP2C family serine/threonine-protein phosphatase [Gemmatimonadaceae bacterium]